MSVENRFFRLLADPAATDRWFLGSPRDEVGALVDPRDFTLGERVGARPVLSVPIRRAGREVDFNFCDFDMIVTPSSLNTDLQALVGDSVERIKVTVEGSRRDFEILNICSLVDCLDRSRTIATTWKESDGRPDRIGRLRMIAKLKVDPTAAGGHHIFRLLGWPIAVIVSDEVRRMFLSSRVSGVVYEDVT